MVTGGRRRALVSAALLLAAACVAHAGDARPSGRRALARQARVIAVARCTAVRSSWNAERTLISTYATYEVEEAVTGAAPGDHVLVKALGGTVGSLSQFVVDGPRFEVGSRDVLFLVAADEPGALRTVGLGRGQWRVATDPVRGEDVVIGESEQTAAPAREPLGAVLEDLRQDRQ